MSPTAIVPFGRNMSGSTEIAKTQSKLAIAINMGRAVKCHKCEEIITGNICFCSECMKFMHLKCAGINVETVRGRDGKKKVVLPAPEEFPLSCCDCLRRKQKGNGVTPSHRSLDQHQGSSTVVISLGGNNSTTGFELI